jgi:NAD+ kinase
MRIAIYGRATPSNLSEFVGNFFKQLESLNIEYIIHEPFYQSLSKVIDFKTVPGTYHAEIRKEDNIDYMISLGGDGTLLDALIFVAKKDIPILGINTGKLGFLSSVSKNEYPAALTALIEKKYTLQNRSLLKFNIQHSAFNIPNSFALNEISIQKKNSSSMVSINCSIDGEFLNTYWADGLIVATPTGSTAYSLSCGGPILLPYDSSFIITPIAPHNLNVRPIIVPDSSVITLTMNGKHPYLVSLDSRSQSMELPAEIVICKESFGIQLIQLHGQSFTETLRKKLNWGKDARNE